MNKDWQHTDAAGLPEKKYKRSSEDRRSRRDDGDLNRRDSSGHQYQRNCSSRDEGPLGVRGNHDHTWHTPYTNLGYHSRARRGNYEWTRYRKDYDAVSYGGASSRGRGYIHSGHHGTSTHHEYPPYHRYQGGGHRHAGNVIFRPPEHWSQSSRGDMNKYTKSSADGAYVPSSDKNGVITTDQEKLGSPPGASRTHQFKENNESVSTLLDSSTTPSIRSGHSHVCSIQANNDVSHHYANSAIACDTNKPASLPDINHFLTLTYEKISSILYAFDEQSQLELKKLLESTNTDQQQIEKLTREIKAIRHRPPKTADVSHGAKFAKNYYKYQEVDRNLRLIEADLAEVHQQIEALISKTVTDAENGSHFVGFWPDSTWNLPAFHDYIKGSFIINYGDMEEGDIEVPSSQSVST